VTSPARAFLLSLLLAGTAPSALPAQDTTAIPASLLRALAEAADVDRTGRPVYLVADRRFPHYVIGRFETRAQAMSLRADSGSAYGVFGPFVTPADPAPPASASKVYRVRLFYRNPQGVVRTKDVDPVEVDALFMTMSAVDKFMVPYYARVYGPEYAARLRDDVVAATVPVGHRLSIGDSLRVGGGAIRPLMPRRDSL
jgi:hypothetical protein